MNSRLSLRTVALIVLAAATTFAQQPDIRTIDSLVEATMKRFEVPGIGLAIVKDGKVLLTRGYGVKELGKPGRVDEHTLFGIASNTKAFTATSLGMLVEEGKLIWDAPVIEYLLAFRLSDPYVTHELTIRDLLVHRSGLGLGAGDLLWWPNTSYDRQEIIRRLRFIPLSTSFRSAYAYDNVLYLVAGEVIHAVSGQTWEEFVRSRIFNRIGMNESTVTCNFPRTGNVAVTHGRVDGVVRVVQPDTSGNTNPAGGIHASAHDMARWMITQLDSGRCGDGTRIFQPELTRQLWSVVTPISPADPPRGMEPSRADFFGYGLGFFIRDYRSLKCVYHDGGLPGYVSRVFLLPSEKLGITVMTNQEATAAFKALVFALSDRFLGKPEFDWIGAVGNTQNRLDSLNRHADRATMIARDTQSRPSLPVGRYAGTYRDSWYGDVRVTAEGEQLRLTFSRSPMLTGRMEHFQYETFIVRWDERELNADAFVTFDIDPDGSIHRVRMKAFSRSTDFSFDFQDLDLRPVAPEHH